MELYCYVCLIKILLSVICSNLFKVIGNSICGILIIIWYMQSTPDAHRLEKLKYTGLFKQLWVKQKENEIWQYFWMHLNKSCTTHVKHIQIYLNKSCALHVKLYGIYLNKAVTNMSNYLYTCFKNCRLKWLI